MSVDVANESGVEVDERALLDLCRHVLSAMQVHPLAEVFVRAVDAAEMTRLHERYLDESGPTDVLAFPMDEAPGPAGPPDLGEAVDEDLPPVHLGDVVLCPQVAARQAPAAGHSTADELALLCTHGLLHLLGYDHGEPDDEREMFALQDRLLASWRARPTRERRS